jgi:hypothetical protein
MGHLIAGITPHQIIPDDPVKQAKGAAMLRRCILSLLGGC